MTETDETPTSEENNSGAQLRLPRAGLLRYLEDNPLAAIAAGLIVSVILARFAFLGNPKER